MKIKNKKELIYTIIPLVVIATGLIVFFSKKKRKKKENLKTEKIADEGYETAADILFPLKSASNKYKKQFISN